MATRRANHTRLRPADEPVPLRRFRVELRPGPPPCSNELRRAALPLLATSASGRRRIGDGGPEADCDRGTRGPDSGTDADQREHSRSVGTESGHTTPRPAPPEPYSAVSTLVH